MSRRFSTKKSGFFELKEWWEDDWEGMPEFVQRDRPPFRSLIVHFRNEEDLNTFAELVNQTVTNRTKYIWYPKLKQKDLKSLKYVDSEESES